MAPFFIFPPNLSSLELEPEDNRLFARNPTPLSSHLTHLVQGVCFDLSDKEVFCIEEQDVFDRVYSLIKNFSSLSQQAKFNLVESLRSNFSVLLPNIESLLRTSTSANSGSKGDEEGNDNNEDEEGEEDKLVLDRVLSYRNAFKIYTYFLCVIVINEEGSGGSGNPAKVSA